MITLPEMVRQKVAISGEEGLKWLADLDDLVRALEQEWQIQTEGSALEGGSEAYIVRAITRDGSSAMLKKWRGTRCWQMRWRPFV